MGTTDHGARARAVYDATAGAYVEAIGTEIDPAIEAPGDRALLASFAEAAAVAGGTVADLGCGPCRVAALLADHGVPTIGLDVSEGMARASRSAHPHVAVGVGDLRRLPLATGKLGGAVCWYSIIHTPGDELEALFTEIARVAVAGAPLLVAFQTAADGRVDRADAHGSGLPLTSFRHHVDTVAAALSGGGFHVERTTVRGPSGDHEQTDQAFVLARRR